MSYITRSSGSNLTPHRKINLMVGLVVFHAFVLNCTINAFVLKSCTIALQIGDWHARRGLGIKHPNSVARPFERYNNMTDPNKPIYITSILVRLSDCYYAPHHPKGRAGKGGDMLVYRCQRPRPHPQYNS